MTTVPLRSPAEVMRLARLGVMQPTRLSFARAMLRRAAREGWRVARAVWSLDAEGHGHAVLRLDTPSRPYSLVAFTQALDPSQRTDRVIAEAWDTTYVLYDGVPDENEIARLAAEVPRQEAGRFGERDLILSRANKSVRLFETVVAALAAGRQPTAEALDEVGYLMRTTAVYGNGKFGIADRDILAARPEFAGPFRAEMLTVWLIRAFTVMLADHCAAARNPAAATLAPHLRRRLGVGNSTGLGMAPFLVRHPVLLNNWMLARETALARVRSQTAAAPASWRDFLDLIGLAIEEAAAWRSGDAVEAGHLDRLEADLRRLSEAAPAFAEKPMPWDALYRWAASHLGPEAQDKLVALIIEPHGAMVDDLADAMDADERLAAAIDGSVACAALARQIEADYGWALALDQAAPETQARFWYVSADKLEPRLGERRLDPGADLEQPLAFARDVTRLREALAETPEGESVAAFLLRRPEHRHAVRRVQIAARYPYAEIRDNLIGATMRPVDLLRCKLAFFGAARFDPRSDRWLRISLFRDAPFPDEIATQPCEAKAA